MTTKKKSKNDPAAGEVTKRLAEEEPILRRLSFFATADALRSFLDGRAETLDEAFGITRKKPRGRPSIRQARDMKIAREVHEFRTSPGAQKRGALARFEEKIAERYGLSDVRKVREICEKHRDGVIVEELLKRARARK